MKSKLVQPLLAAATTFAVGAGVFTQPVQAAPASDPSACVAGLAKPMRFNAVPQRAEAAVHRKVEGSFADADADQLQDETGLWVDQCGAPFYKEPAAASQAPEVEQALYPDNQTFLLNSRPGAAKTIYLDFDGSSISNTVWNYNAPATITSPAFTRDGSASFNSTELAEVQNVWAIVAEDFAPYDVNVTTQAPSNSAMVKDFYGDQTYGITAVITQATNHSVGSTCGCGGIAYVGITGIQGEQNFAYYNPAFVFADRLYVGRNVAEAASHELGHNLGLNHDGTSTQGYYPGVAPWAPIMGVGYQQPLTQWSKGEYADANNKQDDVSIIAESFPHIADDYPSSLTSSPLPTLPNNALVGETRSGLIERNTDQDVFKFMGAGSTSLEVASPSIRTNLDAVIEVYTQTGELVARANPLTTADSADVARGASAYMFLDLPSDSRTYYAVVKGGGQGNVLAGGYSSYGSLGGYVLTLVTDGAGTPEDPPLPPQPPTPPTPETPDPPANPVSDLQFPTYSWENLQVGKAFGNEKLKVYGGNGVYIWSATGLPAGLALSSDGVLYGTPKEAGNFTSKIYVESGGAKANRTFTFGVLPQLQILTKSKLPKASKGKRYWTYLDLRGGMPSYSWTLKGALPKGLKLQGASNTYDTGVKLAGKPKKAGTYRFVLTARDGSGGEATRSFKLIVRPRR